MVMRPTAVDARERASRKDPLAEISGELRRLIVDGHGQSAPQRRASFGALVRRARLAQLGPEQVLAALKQEWHRIAGMPARGHEDTELSAIVSLCIEAYYSPEPPDPVGPSPTRDD